MNKEDKFIKLFKYLDSLEINGLETLFIIKFCIYNVFKGLKQEGNLRLKEYFKEEILNFIQSDIEEQEEKLTRDKEGMNQ